MAKKKDGYGWNELIQMNLDPTDKNAIVEVWFPKLLKKQMLGFIIVDITNPKMPKTPVWYKIGKSKDNPPKQRGEIEVTFEVVGKKKAVPAPNLKEMENKLGLDFVMPTVSPRPMAIDPTPHLSELKGEGGWMAMGEVQVGKLEGGVEVSCEAGTVKFTFNSAPTTSPPAQNNSGAQLSVWLPRGDNNNNNNNSLWTKSYQQANCCRCETIFPKIQPRPCFKVKVSFVQNNDDDLVGGLVDGKFISEANKDVISLRACFKISKAKVQEAISKDKIYDSPPQFDERELLDVSFKGIPEKVKACLDRWDDVNWANENNETALHKAVMNGSQEVIMLLVERGADPKIQDKFGQTPVNIAEKYFKKDLVPLLRTYQ